MNRFTLLFKQHLSYASKTICPTKTTAHRLNRAYQPQVIYNYSMKKTTGFTLIELVMIIAVLAIVIAVGVPRLGNISSNNRMTTAINNLTADITYARSEAITRNANIDIVANGGNWANGWQIQDGGTVLRNAPALLSTFTLTEAASITTITFSGDGIITTASPTLLLCKNGESGTYGKQVDITVSGQNYLTTGASCP